MAIEFFVPGKPIPKARPRVTKAGQTYTPKRCRQYEERVAKVAAHSYDGEPIDGACVLTMTAVMPRPQRLMAKRYSRGRIYHPKRPDLDNLLKSVMDGLSKAGIWVDDARVTRTKASKFYAGIGETPGVYISISEDLGEVE